MNDYAGESGGGSTSPIADIEFEPVEMETVSVAGLGDALIKDAANLKLAAETIKEQLADPSGKRGRDGREPVGADPRQETLHSLISTHSARMTDTRRFLDNAAEAVRNLGLLSKYIASELGDTDALNAVSVDKVKSIIDSTKGSDNGEEQV